MSLGFKASAKTEVKRAEIIPMDFTNALCYGQTGSGKTTGFILPNINERMKAGQGMLIYVYKTNFEAMVKSLALQNGRLDDVIEIGTPWSKSINLLKSVSQTDLKAWFDGINDEKNDYWKNSAYSLLTSINKALNALHELSKNNLGLRKYENEVGLASIAEFCDIKKLKELHADIFDWIEKANEQRDTFEAEYKTKLSKQKCAEAEKAEKIEEKKESKEELDDVLEMAKNLVPIEDDEYFSIAYEFEMKKEPQIKADAFVFDELVEAHEELANFTELEKSDSGTGNRGVMEVLQNMINQAKELDSLSKSELSLDEIVNSNKIVIVNTTIMGESLARLFNICFTSKLIFRLKEDATPVPWSVFIDEAHKILSKNCLPETSVCRESCFEYIMCVQNKYLLAKALGITNIFINDEINDELSVITQNIAHQLSFYDPTNVLCASLDKHEFVHLECSKLSKTKGKAEPIFMSKSELRRALASFCDIEKIYEKVIFSADIENISFLKALSAKKALLYYNDGSIKESKIMPKSKLNIAKQKAIDIINNKKEQKKGKIK